jgi:hypothetical protein
MHPGQGIAEMSKLKLPESARKARGLPDSIEPVIPAPLSRKQQRKLAQKEVFDKKLVPITERVKSLSLDDAKARLIAVKAVLFEINRDLKLYESGQRDMPKLIESGFAHEIWAHRAKMARSYFCYERRCLIDKIKGGAK